ncbi:TPA: hypothetical protein RUW99_003140 [Aeromonas veronii]|nr:hypothetical protein [Aeromonas veronii]
MRFEIVGRQGVCSLSIAELPSSGYLLAGMGNYSQLILQRLQEMQRPLPVALIDTMTSDCSEKFGLPVIDMTQASQHDLSIIIGSSPYDYEQEVMAKLRQHGCYRLVALEPEEILPPLLDPLADSLADTESWPVLLLVCMLDHHVQQLASLMIWLHQRQILCRVVRSYDAHAIMAIPPSRLLGAIIWNGTPAYYDSVKQYLQDMGKQYLYAELGFFPQREHVYLDRQGVNLGRCMGLMPCQKDDAEQELVRVRERLLGGRLWVPGDAVVVPLQIATDTNVRLYSNYGDKMQQFIDDVIRDYGNERLLFKPHPLDPLGDTYDFHGREIVSGDFMTLALSSKFICGINSSTLFEARLVGIPVHFYGRSLLSECPDEQEVMLQMVQNQFRVDGSDLVRKIGPYMQQFGIEI